MIVNTDLIPPEVSMSLLKTMGLLTQDVDSSPTSLAKAIGVSTAAMTGIVDAGEERGWIKRERKSDRRKIAIILTEAGKAAVEAMTRLDGQEAAA